MSNVTVVGAQWGDEGKGKVVDWLSLEAGVVVRFQGGHNAGHTLVVHGVEHRLSLLPSAVVRPGKRALIGPGVVLDPEAFLAEVKALEGRGISLSPERLGIDSRVSLILPCHARVDRAREAARGPAALGTTGRGIGPAYEDRAGRRALRLADLADSELLRARLEVLLHHNNALLRAFGEEEEDGARMADALAALAEPLLSWMADVPGELAAAGEAGERVLFEGAQGALLDLSYGTYPFVTSSHTLPAQAALGAGVPPRAVGRVLGIVKAYATRVGAGPFAAELEGPLGERLGKRGAEFGTVTGRKRRCGWLDAAALRRAVAVAGIDALVLTKLDVLDGLEEVRFGVGYEGGEGGGAASAAGLHPQAGARPVWEALPGWQGPTAGVRRFEDLPPAAQAYVSRLEALAGVPVWLISTSPEREDMIVRRDPWAE